MSDAGQPYQVIARKYRPRRFSELIGQDHVVRTLRNTIAQGRVGHAYLLVGSRGVGKTTTARIFAKALNCESNDGSPEPCCECNSCREIANASSLDVIEIDGASHNGVDDVRELRDNVAYAPSRSRYKIYIIDEVHMLTQQAWNALLKTLEEPPRHVKFFFATTEPQKVLPTVVSRCQRFDLKRISPGEICGRLKEIADAENVNIEEKALNAVARAAEGSLRDAQSIFDQIISFCGSDGHTISEPDVIDVFGLASTDELMKLAKAVLSDDVGEVVGILQALADHGRDLERTYTDLLYTVRNLMVASSCTNPGEILEVTDTELDGIRQLCTNVNTGTVCRVLDALVSAEGDFKYAFNKRVAIETILVRAMGEAHSMEIDDLISKLNQLRDSGFAVPVASDPAGSSGSTDAAAGNGTTEPADADAQLDVTGEEKSAEKRDDEQNAAAPAPEDDLSNLEETPEKAEDEQASNLSADDSAVAQETATGSAAQATGENTLHIADTDDVRAVYQAVLRYLSQTGNDQLQKYMQALWPVSIDDEVFQLAYDDSMPAEHLTFLQQADVTGEIEAAVAAVMPGEGRPQLLLKRWIESVSKEDRNPLAVVTPEMRDNIKKQPFVQKVCELFNGQVVDVRPGTG